MELFRAKTVKEWLDGQKKKFFVLNLPSVFSQQIASEKARQIQTKEFFSVHKVVLILS